MKVLGRTDRANMLGWRTRLQIVILSAALTVMLVSMLSSMVIQSSEVFSSFHCVSHSHNVAIQGALSATGIREFYTQVLRAKSYRKVLRPMPQYSRPQHADKELPRHPPRAVTSSIFDRVHLNLEQK